MILYSLLIFNFICCFSKSIKQQIIQPSIATSDVEYIQAAKDAYIYGYPLVMMEISKRVMTNYETASGQGAPVNQICRKEEFPDDKFRAVVKPNCDTYYALAWLDLSQGPLVLEVPDTRERYFLLPILDGWTNVIASPGKRTTGTQAQLFLITSADWKGKVPKLMKHLISPTKMAWLVGRTQVNSKEDGSTVVKVLQEGFHLVPLSSYGKKNYTPPTGKKDTSLSMKPPVKQVSEMPVEAYFNLLNQLMIDNPPFAGDSSILHEISKLGIGAGNRFDLSKFSNAVQDSIKMLPQWCKKYLADLATKKEKINGWLIFRGLGDYGTNYDLRAMIAGRGLGANLDADALYPSSSEDADHEKYDGSKHKYVLHFDAGKFPPAKAFWSITMYNLENYLVPNAINRFALGDRNDLKKNPDGSLDIFIQSENPGTEKVPNWLPSPPGTFNITLRIYWPEETALNGSWIPPAVVKAD